MKKYILLLITILLFGLISCSSEDSGGGETPSTSESGETQTTQTDSSSDGTTTDAAASTDEETAGGEEYPYPGQAQSSFDPTTVSRPAADQFPKFSGKLSFHSNRLGPFEIYVLDGSSSLLTRLSRGENETATEAAWEPGCENVYMTLGDANNHFFIGKSAAAEGATPEIFLDLGDTIAWNASPSPNGDVIAHQVNRDRRINTCFVSPTGEDLGCMERGAFSNSSPFWSSDGTKIAFSTDRDNNAEIYIMDYPGGAVTRLTETPYFSDRSPSISPDGTRVAFQSLRGAGQDIFVVNIDGTNEVQVTEDGAENKNPIWVGDDQIAFQSSKTGNVEIYITSVDNPNPVQLTYNLAEDSWPAWCPAS